MTIQFAPRWIDATTNQTCIVGNAADIASGSASTLLDLQVNNVSKFTVDKFGELIITPTARTSGSDSLLNLIAPADTTRAASTEATDINFNLARTVQFAAGNIAAQRAVRIQAPTYSFASASTITNAATFSISGAPVAGTNATLTNRWALSIENNGIKLAFPSTSTSSLGSSRPSSNQWMYLVNTTNTPNRPIGIVFGGYDDFFHMALQSVMTSGGGNTYGKLSFVQQGGSEWLKIATSLTAEQNGVSIAESLNFGVLASNISPDTSLVREAAGVLAFRRSTTSHIARLYNTFTDASNYERLAFQFGTFSSARHAQIAAESAGTGTANIDLVLTPRGTGAFILGPPPDGTTTGGNARGQYAVDLQVSRGLNTQVASGQYSFVSGFSNIANNRCSVAFGYESVTTGADACAIGQRCTASGNASMAINLNSQATGAFSFASGLNSVADRVAMRAHASGSFPGSGSGVAQYVRFVLRNKTVSTTPAELKMWGIDGNNEYRLTIPAGTGLSAIIILKGFKSDGSVGARFTRMVDIKNVGGITSLETTPETYGTDYNPSECVYTISADDVNDALQLAVTGVASETWRWVAVVHGVELAYGT